MNARVADAIRARDQVAAWLRFPLPDEPDPTESRQQWREFLMARHREYNALSVLING